VRVSLGVRATLVFAQFGETLLPSGQPGPEVFDRQFYGNFELPSESLRGTFGWR
jgi:hypothetical protein